MFISSAVASSNPLGTKSATGLQGCKVTRDQPASSRKLWTQSIFQNSAFDCTASRDFIYPKCSAFTILRPWIILELYLLFEFLVTDDLVWASPNCCPIPWALSGGRLPVPPLDCLCTCINLLNLSASIILASIGVCSVTVPTQFQVFCYSLERKEAKSNRYRHFAALARLSCSAWKFFPIGTRQIVIILQV